MATVNCPRGGVVYALAFPERERELRRGGKDGLGMVLDFGSCDPEIMSWCMDVFGPPNEDDEPIDSWRGINDIFYFANDSDRMACMLRWD